MKKCLERVVQRKVHCESRGDMWFNKRVLTFQKNLLHPCVCTLVMRAVNASEVAMRMTQSTRLHFPEDSNLFLIMVCSRCASKKNSVSQKILMLCLLLLVCENRSVGIATCYKLEGSENESRWGGGAVYSSPVQTDPEVHPASCTMGTRSFSGVKRPVRGVDHPPPSSAEVKERAELHIYSFPLDLRVLW